MARLKRGPIGGTIVDYRDARRAASLLKGAQVDVSIERVTDVMCPGVVHRNGYMLVVPGIDRAKAMRILKENGF
jgi:hypothetical protein